MAQVVRFCKITIFFAIGNLLVYVTYNFVGEYKK